MPWRCNHNGSATEMTDAIYLISSWLRAALANALADMIHLFFTNDCTLTPAPPRLIFRLCTRRQRRSRQCSLLMHHLLSSLSGGLSYIAPDVHEKEIVKFTTHACLRDVSFSMTSCVTCALRSFRYKTRFSLDHSACWWSCHAV